MKTKLVVLGIVIVVAGCILGITALAISGANDSARAQVARVAACSHVRPASARGACVEGKPATVTQTIIRNVGRAPTYTVDGLIQRCIALAAQDQKDIEQVIGGSDIPGGAWGGSVAAGFGTCLSGVFASSGPGNNDPVLPTK